MYHIVIPTYEPHFDYNYNFLESFNKHCIDKNDVIINFILNTDNIELFKTKIINFNNLNIKLYTLSELIYKVDNIDEKDHPCYFSNKYCLQSMKKLFSYTITNNNDYIVMDSENLCIKNFRMEDIFVDLKKKPLLYSKIIQDIQFNVIKDCNNILNTDINLWFFLKSYWFFEYEYVEKLINYLRGSCGVFNKLKNKIFFEYQLYCNYLYFNKYKNFIFIDEIVNNEVENIHDVNYEYLCTKLNNNNIDKYCCLVKKMDEKILRLHWMSEEHANYVINNTNINIGTYHWD